MSEVLKPYRTGYVTPKQIVIQFGSAGIVASSWYIAGVFSVINPVVGFLAGTAWYFGMQGLWEIVSNEL